MTQALLVLCRYLLSLSVLTKYSSRQLRDVTRSWFGLSALVGTARTIVGHQTICYPACHNRPDNTQLQHPVERSAKAKLQAGIYAGGFVKSKSECLGFQGLSKLHISRSDVKLTIIINIVVVFSLQIRRANSSSHIGFEFPVAVLVSVG